jgi:HAD superfamily hydrolase (TIGR01490 family)
VQQHSDSPLSSARPRPDVEKTTVFFDLDRTLLPGSSLVCLGQELVRSGELDRATLARGLVRNVAFARRGAGDAAVGRLRAGLLELAAERPYEPMVNAAVSAAASVARRTFPAARSLVDQHRRAGDAVVIVSASPQELVAAVAVAIGADLGVGTRVAVRDGRLTGRVDGVFCYGKGKLARIREELGALDLGRATAYADSLSDLPLLRSCGRPVATNPDRGLLRAARAAGWPVLRFV